MSIEREVPRLPSDAVYGGSDTVGWPLSPWLRAAPRAPDLLGELRALVDEVGPRVLLLTLVDAMEYGYGRSWQRPPVDDPWSSDPQVDHRSWEEQQLDRIAAEVGGRTVLDELDSAPLPDEAFDDTAVPDDRDVAGRVTEMLELVDLACERFFDIEHRTACRRMLADLARRAPEVITRGRMDTAAAALVWLVAKVNDSFGSTSGGLTVGELGAWFRLSGSPSGRSHTLLRALGGGHSHYDRTWSRAPLVGTPRYLVSAKRRALIDERDRLQGAVPEAAREDGSEVR